MDDLRIVLARISPRIGYPSATRYRLKAKTGKHGASRKTKTKKPVKTGKKPEKTGKKQARDDRGRFI